MTAFLAYINLPVQYLEYLITKLNEMGIEVKGIASHRSGRQRTLDKYPQLRYYSMASFNDFTTWEAPFDEGLFRQVIGPDLEEVLPISDRYPSFGNGSIESMNRVFWEFSLANKALSEVRPDLLLFFKEPESVLEYMLYKLAKHLGIKVLMTRATTFTHSRGVADNYELPLLSKDLTITPGTIDIGDKTGLHPQSENILKKVSAMESSYMPNYMKAQNIDFSFLSFLNYYSQFHNIKLLIADGLRQKQGHLYRFRLYNKYQKLVSEVIPEKNSLKIYFPLHYQPEQTTMPLGASFVNQTKSIKLLSDKLPDGAVIYVKEHISTFAKALKPNINFRPYHFYKTLASIPKVRLVSVHFPSQKLQSICDFTVSITGTACWESVLRGKPAVIFGYTSWSTMPGIFNYREISSDFFVQLQNSPTIDRTEVKRYLEQLEGITHQPKDPEVSISGHSAERYLLYLDTLLLGVKKFRSQKS